MGTSPKMPGFPALPTLAEVHDPNGTEIMSSRTSGQFSQPIMTPSIDAVTVSSSSPSVDASTRITPTPPPISPSNVQLAMLAQGTEVEIDGPLQCPDFNGRSGTVQSWDPILRRYNVLLDSRSSGGGQRY